MNRGYITTGRSGISPLQAGTVITLPPGSVSDDLQAAINGAASDDIIVISSDMDFSSAVTIPAGLAITVQSSMGNNWVMAQTVLGFRHFVVEGSLLLYNVTLDGNMTGGPGTDTRGGVQVQPGGSFDMRATTIIRNCFSGNGGGVTVTGGNMTMRGGSITSNIAVAGGGVYVASDGTLTISGGTISGNESMYGGGIYLDLGSEGTMTGGVIGGSAASDANIASAYAGGVAVYRSSRFVLDGGVIEGNRVESASGGVGGGGAYVINSSVFELRSGAIRNNFAGAGAAYPSYGGGVMLGELTYTVPPGLAPASTFLMTGGFIEGNESGYRGGGVSVVANCNFIMTGGAIRGNIATTNINGGGGGVHIGSVLESTGVTFTMDGGMITGNSGLMGGGVLILGSQTNPSFVARFIMNSGEITGNESTATFGGGVCVLNLYSEFIAGNPAGGLAAPVVANNRANTDGGGVYTSGTCVVNGARVSGNTAGNGNGGGVYVTAAGTLAVSGGGFITDSRAPNGNGGGIYTESFDYADPADIAAYANITTAADTVFRGNTASAAYAPPSNASSFTNIGYAETSIRDTNGYVHPLNNYDINYVGPTELALYSVAYNAGGGMGGYLVTNIVSGSVYTVLSAEEAGISRPGYTFTGWNTAANGTGTPYGAGDMITITGDLILYAQWVANEAPGCIPPPYRCVSRGPLCCRARPRQCCKAHYSPCREHCNNRYRISAPVFPGCGNRQMPLLPILRFAGPGSQTRR